MALPALAVQGALATAKKVLSNKYVIMVIVLLILVFIFKSTIKNMIKSFRQNKFNKQEDKDVNMLAQQYRSASNPSGTSWLIDLDGTNTDEIEKLAYQSQGSLKEIADAYRLKFDEALTDRLRKEMDGKDFQNWRNIVT